MLRNRCSPWRHALAIAAFAAACGRSVPRPAPAPDAAPPTVVHTQDLDAMTDVRIEIPTAGGGPRPAVLSFVDSARLPLLRQGIAVVTYVTHWERLQGLAPKPAPPTAGQHTVGRWLLASPSAAEVGRGYFAIIDVNASTTVPHVVDAMARDPELDRTRFGIVGVSTNGFVALQAAAGGSFAAAVAIAACGDYRTFLHLSNLAMNGEPLAIAPDYARWLAEREPIRHPERLVGTAVLMVNGRDDTTVPAACATHTARVFERAYAARRAAERFRFVLVAGGHNLGPVAGDEANVWLARWLLGAPPADRR